VYRPRLRPAKFGVCEWRAEEAEVAREVVVVVAVDVVDVEP